MLAAACVAAAIAAPPNLIYLLADDAGWNDFGFTRGLEAPESELWRIVDMIGLADFVRKDKESKVAAPAPVLPPVRKDKESKVAAPAPVLPPVRAGATGLSGGDMCV